MRIALAQIDSVDDVQSNLARICERVTAAAAAGAEVVLFPEYAMYEKKIVDESFVTIAEPVDGPFARAVASHARAEGLAIVLGMVESDPDAARAFNTLVAFDSDGGFAGRYRKQHLYDAYGFRESAWISRPQPEAIVVTLAGTQFGLMTCNDLRYPALATRLATDGAEVIAVCSSWVPGPTKVEQWQVLARARAIENLCFVAAVSQAPPVSIGCSLLIDSMGTVLGELGPEPGLLCVDIDPAQVQRQRRLAAS